MLFRPQVLSSISIVVDRRSLCNSLVQCSYNLKLTKTKQHCHVLTSEGLVKLDNIVGEHVNHNVGRFFVSFIEVAKLGNIVRQQIRFVINLVLLMLF